VIGLDVRQLSYLRGEQAPAAWIAVVAAMCLTLLLLFLINAGFAEIERKKPSSSASTPGGTGLTDKRPPTPLAQTHANKVSLDTRRLSTGKHYVFEKPTGRLGQHVSKNFLIFSDGTGQAVGLMPNQSLSNE